ncbi:Probable arabinosyltransferase ARAD1 [Linum perenne]
MRSSKFCLHPAGDTPSSCRLFDAIVSHCVPVVVSDKIELPYEDEIDYTKFSLFFSDSEALKPGYLVDQLRKFPKDRWLEMWRNLKNISHHFEFEFPPVKGDAADMLWRQVRRKLPEAQLAVHRSHRLRVPDWWRRRR